MNGITLYVSDIERSARFYSALGMQLLQDDPAQPVGYEVIFSYGDHSFYMQLHPTGPHPPTRTRLRIEVPSIDGLAERLTQSGIEFRIDDWLPILRTADPDGTGIYALPHRTHRPHQRSAPPN